MNPNLYHGTIKCDKSHDDYYIDAFDCSDKVVEQFIEARREQFREEWFEYVSKFYD